MAALAALLVVGGALIAGLLAVRMDERQAVLVVARDVPVGARLAAGDLVETRVAADGLRLVPASRKAEALQLYAKVAMSKGQLLDDSMMSREAPLASGKAAVGVSLAEGRYPGDGLVSGATVMVARIGSGTVKGSIIGTALVLKVGQQATKDSGLGAKSSSDTQTVTLLVDSTDVGQVVDAAGNNKIALALVPAPR